MAGYQDMDFRSDHRREFGSAFKVIFIARSTFQGTSRSDASVTNVAALILTDGRLEYYPEGF
jgi:hypothetical protein